MDREGGLYTLFQTPAAFCCCKGAEERVLGLAGPSDPKESFLLGGILKPSLERRLERRLLSSELFSGRWGRQACQSLGTGRGEMGKDGWPGVPWG